MRSKSGDLTPREEAILILMGWAEAAFKGLTDDLFQVDDRDSFRLQVRRALAKEHNRLARRVESMGNELNDETNHLPFAVASTDKYEEKDDDHK